MHKHPASVTCYYEFFQHACSGLTMIRCSSEGWSEVTGFGVLQNQVQFLQILDSWTHAASKTLSRIEPADYTIPLKVK